MSPLEDALDPHTSAVRLTRLARTATPEVARAIARHPNASDRLLRDLVLRFPDEVAANPRVVLMGLAGELPPFLTPRGRALLLAQPSAPLELLMAKAERASSLERFALLCNPRFTGHVRFAEFDLQHQYEVISEFTEALAGLPPVPDSVRVRLPPIFDALDPHAPPERLVAEARALSRLDWAPFPNSAERWCAEALCTAVGRRPALAATFVEALVAQVVQWIRRAQRESREEPRAAGVYRGWLAALVAHPALAPRRDALARGEPEVRAVLAEAARASGAPSPFDPSAPSPTERRLAARATRDPEVLVRLAGDPDPRVRLEVAGHPDAPPEVLARLAVDAACARVAQAALPRVADPGAILTALAACPWTSARIALARSTVHPEVFAALLRDGNAWVRAAASDRARRTG